MLSIWTLVKEKLYLGFRSRVPPHSKIRMRTFHWSFGLLVLRYLYSSTWLNGCLWIPGDGEGELGFVCWLLACLTSQQHASVSQGWRDSDTATFFPKLWAVLFSFAQVNPAAFISASVLWCHVCLGRPLFHFFFVGSSQRSVLWCWRLPQSVAYLPRTSLISAWLGVKHQQTRNQQVSACHLCFASVQITNMPV